MKRVLLFISILMVASCSSKMKLQKRAYSFIDNPVEASYLLSDKNQDSKKLAFIFPDNLDSINWNENALVSALSKKDYRILIPLLPGKSEVQKIAFDNRNNRIGSAILIYNQLLSLGEVDSSSEILLLGIGEGAYIIPYLSNAIPEVKNFMMVNAAGASFLGELQLLVSEQDTSFLKSRKMQFFGMDNIDEVKKAIQEILTKQGNARSLGNRTNGDWFSYYEHNLDGDLSLVIPSGHFILSEKYPFVSKTSKEQLNILLKNHPLLDITIHQIEGDGYINKEEELLKLTKKIEELIN